MVNTTEVQAGGPKKPVDRVDLGYNVYQVQRMFGVQQNRIMTPLIKFFNYEILQKIYIFLSFHLRFDVL